MDQVIINRLKKDKYYEYLKENSHYIKDLNRYPQNYELFKNFVKDKYHLRITDKVSNAIDDIELINSVLNTIK